MPKKSYATQIADTKLMVDALRANLDNVTKIDAEFVNQLEADRNKAEELNTKQEKLKADLKALTEELNAVLDRMDTAYATAQKRVKVDIPQAQWKEFGITVTK